MHGQSVRIYIPVVAHRKQLPVALTIAGSDSGGGAGIQADLKTFAALHVHGTTAITCLTAQNPKSVCAVEPVTPKMVEQQIEAVFAELHPVAAKTGMLFSAEIIESVVKCWKHAKIPLVVDPVMVSTSGVRLLQPAAIEVLQNKLLPICALITPNLDEAEILVGEKIRSIEDVRKAAKEIRHRFGCAALVKGGHIKDGKQAADIYWDGKTELLLTAPFVKSVSTHGTGCTYSAAITAYLARGKSLSYAVEQAKGFITKAIAGSYKVSDYYGLNQSVRPG